MKLLTTAPIVSAVLLAACLDHPAPVAFDRDTAPDSTSSADANGPVDPAPDATSITDATSSDSAPADASSDASPGDATADTTPTDASDTTSTASCTRDALWAAALEIQEGDEVIPQTLLHLGVTGIPLDCIAQVRWTVDQPIGATSVFAPSNTFIAPRFETNVAGSYTFRVELTDTTGRPLTALAKRLDVTPDSSIHIELLWTTPGDTDPNDLLGADLDLHFAHGNARSDHDGDRDGQPDPWFDIPFDTFWFNARPDWGSLDPAIDDNPSLDRDDTDGVGPENLNLNAPEDGKTYHVGVHYFTDHDLGPSFATVRIYLHGNLVFEQSDVELRASDFWWVTDLTWPQQPESPPTASRTCQGTTDPCTTDADCTTSCTLRITPNYHHPFFPSE